MLRYFFNLSSYLPEETVLILMANYGKRSLTHFSLDVNCLLFLFSYNENFTVFTNFSKNPKYEASLKSVCWKLLSSLWMDKHDKAYRHYLPLFCESA